MANVLVTELLSITNLSAADVLDMLGRGDLEFGRDAENRLLVNLDSVDSSKIARAPISAAAVKIDSNLVEEIIAAEASRTLAEIFDESLEMAIRWSLKNQPD